MINLDITASPWYITRRIATPQLDWRIKLLLEDYLKLASKIINKYGDYWMMKSEDAIAYVAHQLMVADEKFNGNGNRLQWMVYEGKFAVMKWRQRGQRYGLISLDGVANRDALEYGASKDSANKAEYNELVEHIEKAKYITDLQRKCILNYYIQGMTYEEIGKDAGVSKEAVRQNINSGLGKIRNNVS